VKSQKNKNCLTASIRRQYHSLVRARKGQVDSILFIVEDWQPPLLCRTIVVIDGDIA
jgi:hypothetical protein